MTTTFAIDTDNAITAYAGGDPIPEEQAQFASEKELAKLTSQWPIGRFADTWNSFAGIAPFSDLRPLKKFKDRKTAVGRIWRAIQVLTPVPAQHAAPVYASKAASKKAKAVRNVTATDGAKPVREGSKTEIILAMLRSTNGASLAEIMTATGWQAHSIRGFISTMAKKKSIAIHSLKNKAGQRIYTISN